MVPLPSMTTLSYSHPSCVVRVMDQPRILPPSLPADLMRSLLIRMEW